MRFAGFTMKHLFTLGFIFCIFSSCWRGSPGEQKRYSSQQAAMVPVESKVYIEAVDVIGEAVSDQDIDVIIRGNLPNPAYQITGYNVRIDEDKIFIQPNVVYDRDALVIQMLVPFEDTVKVRATSPGDYQIIVEGRGKRAVRSLKIK